MWGSLPASSGNHTVVASLQETLENSASANFPQAGASPFKRRGNKPILHSLELWRSHLDRDGSGKENDLKTPSPALLLAVGFCHQAEGLPASYPGLKKPHLFRHFQDKFLFSKGTLKFFCFLLELQDLYHRTRSRDAPCCCPEDTQCIVTSVQPSPSSCGSPVSPVSPRHTTSCY